MNIQYYSKKSRTYQSPPSHITHLTRTGIGDAPRGGEEAHNTQQQRRHTQHTAAAAAARQEDSSSNTAALIYSLHSTPTLLPLAPYPDQ